MSVVIPTRGRSDYVARAIDSVLHQSYDHFEVLILDSSPEPERAKIRKIADLDARIVFVDRGNSGLTVARHLGALLAHGPLYAMLDSDDYWAHERLAKHVRVWGKYRIGLSWDRWAEVANSRTNIFPQPYREGFIKPPHLAAVLFRKNLVHASSGIVGTDYARKFGFPLHQIMSSDWLLFMRAAESYPAYFIGETLSFRDCASPDRITNKESKSFFEWENKTIRRWVLKHRPQVYALAWLSQKLQYRLGLNRMSTNATTT